MRTTVRLTMKQHRFGLVGFALVLLSIAGASAGIAGYYQSIGLGRCLGDTSSTCMAISQQASLVDLPARLARVASLPIAVLAGVFIGVPVVAAEIERGTAVLPWTMGRSRIRWFLSRVLIIGVVLALLASLLGLALDALQQSLEPGVPLSASLHDYEARGWLVPARSLVGFASGVFAGALLGRSLPGLLVGLVVGTALVGGVIPLGDMWNRTNPTDVSGDSGALQLGLGLRDRTTGDYLTYPEGEAIMDPNDPAFSGRFQEVSLGLPGADAGLVVGREVVVHGLEVLTLLTVSTVVVNKRRPY